MLIVTTTIGVDIMCPDPTTKCRCEFEEKKSVILNVTQRRILHACNECIASLVTYLAMIIIIIIIHLLQDRILESHLRGAEILFSLALANLKSPSLRKSFVKETYG